jgi:hypothetical protein
MMANAAKDPLWQAKVASEVARTPALQEVIEGTCALCHMPMAYTQAEVSGQPTLMLGDGFLNPANSFHEAGGTDAAISRLYTNSGGPYR